MKKFIFISMIFFSFAFLGWIWEILWEMLKNGNLINSGVLHGPWLPIYGCGALFIYLILYRFKKNKIVIFFGCFIICSIIEYITSIYLEKKYGLHWWNYSKRPFNLNGRVCLLYSTAFGIAGYFGIYDIIPFIKKIYKKINYKLLVVLNIILISLFTFDICYSFKYPHIVKRYKVSKYSIIKANH